MNTKHHRLVSRLFAAAAAVAFGVTLAGTASAAPSEGHDPEGRIDGYYWASDDAIVIEGFAFDRDDLSKKVNIMTTVDGKAVWWSYADARSPQLDPYGLPYNGFSGMWIGGGAHTICQYAINTIGGGSTQQLGCIDVKAPSIDPRGDLAITKSGSTITVTGWVIDYSDLFESNGVWIVDNGTVIAQFIANAPTPYLAPYGVPGSHGFGMAYKPASGGAHDICVYALNNGSGNNVWLGCTTV